MSYIKLLQNVIIKLKLVHFYRFTNNLLSLKLNVQYRTSVAFKMLKILVRISYIVAVPFYDYVCL